MTKKDKLININSYISIVTCENVTTLHLPRHLHC